MLEDKRCVWCGRIFQLDSCESRMRCDMCWVGNDCTQREEAVLVGLSCLGAEVAETWRADDYPPDVRSGFAQFRHAAVHVVKAVGQLMAWVDHVEHERTLDAEAVVVQGRIPLLVADLLRCAAKMAEHAPGGSLNLGRAYLARARELSSRWGRGGKWPELVVEHVAANPSCGCPKCVSYRERLAAR